MSQANVEDVRICLDSGEDVRHSDEVHELLMFIGDRQYSVNVINVGIQEFTLATPVVAFWSEDLCTQSTFSPRLRARGHTPCLQ